MLKRKKKRQNKPVNVSILTLFPELYKPFLKESLIGRAQEKGIFTSEVTDLFSFAAPKKRIDAPTFGPGAGMLIKPDILERAIASQEQKFGRSYKIFFSPHGTPLNQFHARRISQVLQEKQHIMLLPARYEGMDARVEAHYADEIISIGDYVLMGGDLPAMVLLEAVLRYVPGVVGKDESVEKDSFSGPLVDYPEYTEPLKWQGMEVPEIIRSGNHQKISEWREEQALKRTLLGGHFEWFRSFDLNERLVSEAQKIIPPHYLALMHVDVNLKENRVGTSSVTSLDIHDIARSAATYGLKKYFIVTPLEDQQKITQTLLDFWATKGKEYNLHRHRAVQLVDLSISLDETIEKIKNETGKDPLLIATSAKKHAEIPQITFYDQQIVWKQERPVLLLLGTASGLADAVLKRCDYLLMPIKGLSDFNHLSVRSAAAVILDRWLGLQQRNH
ncbi:TPA: tRNA (guanosine(37)-N1)-methyltransferase TrmD [Candidatus Dependentiae bacterium]|nr:MAG: tRNA (guanine-N(1)-)-methyltransferase [candidate division TM6 bacterium GW2011_GWF2_36_131]KKQ02824.1 MAG: tRNA (guanine-N(1)-)-methyltransferase [candidate division TM6 bacterium GW2011_GWE2_36_25]KKQ18967.1 MAG: tRNA (guanine-N(1)-)-methyltransferase [candidate division TM6 bacterium GW2011_GWA2_36_9]HBR71002.1 tRNA (guanosine(37)-N1)-methyltransferase TrmD [Candidatus Dependentiae bacterium]HCU00235.1 tRNA (guanosine(37)-N1)-methyltransferase TrmD [Candidatus Dependentiae bacterium]